MSGLRLGLFGGFALATPEDAVLSIPLAKDRALFAYLALHPGESFTRGQLAGLLWGEQPEAKARHGLGRAMRRGLWNVAIQVYLTAAAINLKRLAAIFLPMAWLDAVTDRLRSILERRWPTFFAVLPEPTFQPA